MKLFNRVQTIISDSQRSLKDRVFIVLTLTASFVATIATICDILYKENIVEIITLLIVLVSAPWVTFFGVKRNSIELATKIISTGLILVVMPILFIFGGGPEGASIPWIIFSYMYIGLVLSGWWRVGSLAGMTAVTAILFTIGYHHPELIVQHTRAVFYWDMALGVMEVGVVCFIMTWFQNRMFQNESERAREETRKVEELNRSQNRFFSSMSHEIRTPINSILGLNEIILRQTDASEEIIKDAGNIQGAGRMLLALINDILDFSKIEAGKMDIVPVNYSVASLVSEIVNMMWLRAEQKGLQLKIEVDPSIPAELYGDEVRIKQILVNLLNNAVKYTKEGSVTLHIEKEDVSDNQVVMMFSIIDTGMGIKQDAIPYLFDAFQRVDEQKNTKIEGTGLGLSIVKQLVDLMEGRITVNSVYTQGSTFTVTLRQKVARADAVGDINITGYGSAKSTAYEAGFTAPDAVILIVDDNEMNLEVEKKLLADTEINVDLAKSGAEALALTMERRYDVILMDHLMPEMDGIECLQNIRKQNGGLNNRVPVIALTANAGSENKDLYSRSGFEDYLVKPVSGRQLEDMLLLYLPQSKVTRAEGTGLAKLQMNTSRGYSRKIPVVIAAGSPCDLPASVLKECQIDTIPFIINADDKIFYDGTEAGSDEIIRYMNEGMKVSFDPPTVEEFEQFFGRELKKAHDIIYISAAPGVSEEYQRARRAAKTYGNVHVLNSGSCSSAVGLLALIAYRMATHGATTEKIIEDLLRIKTRLRTTFLTEGYYFLRNKNGNNKTVMQFMKSFNVRTFVSCKDDGLSIERVNVSEMDRCCSQFMEFSIPRLARPDNETAFVVYVDLSEEQLSFIAAMLDKRFSFKNIVFQKASSVQSLICGAGSFGIVYLTRDDNPYNLTSLLERDIDDDEYDGQEDETEEQPETENESVNEHERELKWYEGIKGIDPEAAITNSGSEDALMTVLKLFYESIDSKASELEGFFDAEDWQDYTIKVHALKSSARLVGATELGEDAFGLEMAGKEDRIDYIREHHAATMDKLRGYRSSLAPLFEDTKEPEPEAVAGQADADPSVGEDFDRFLLESVYEAIREGAESKDDETIRETLNEIAEYDVPETDKEILDQIREFFGQGDYEGIISMIGGDE